MTYQDGELFARIWAVVALMDIGKIVRNRSIQYLAIAAILFAIVALLVSGPSAISNKATNGTCAGKVTFDFFYLPTCPHCLAQEAFMPVLENEFPQVTFIRHNLDNTTEGQLLIGMLSARGLPYDHIYTPTTFICDRYFVGFESNQTTGAALRDAIGQVLAARGK
jgi:hypothetical protein